MRLKKEIRQEELLQAALDCARDRGYLVMTREDVASYAECPPSLVSYHLGDMEKVRIEVMRLAIELKDAYVIAQGIIFKDAIALAAPKPLKREALQAICLDGRTAVCLA